MDILFATQNAPFTGALILMFFIAAMEGIGFLVGVSVSGIVDTFMPDIEGPEIDIPDAELPDPDTGLELRSPEMAEAATGSGGFFTKILGWMSFGKVPALIWLVIFLTTFGLSGLLVQGCFVTIAGFFLPGWLATAPALALAAPVTGQVGKGVAHVLPKDESEAVSRDHFVGRVATILRGIAEQGQPAEAKLTDRHGLTHYVLVEPDLQSGRFEAGDRVLIVDRRSNIYRAIIAESDALNN